jgi:jagged-like protein
VDECQQNPCRNAVDCRNGAGNYTCRCLNGWVGRNCEINVNDCRGQCSNGATCIDLVDDYHCACSPGFKGSHSAPKFNFEVVNLLTKFQLETGRHCEVNVNECDSNPCRNGGECVDLINGFKCICPLGYTGHQCQASLVC